MKKLNSKSFTNLGTTAEFSLHDVVHRCTNGRPHATTEQYGFLLNTAPQTIRKNFSQTGDCFGIKPIKIGNRLFWSTTSIIRLLGGE